MSLAVCIARPEAWKACWNRIRLAASVSRSTPDCCSSDIRADDAIVCSALCGLIAAGLLDASRIAWLAAGVMISVVAQWGDLFESSLKRRYGVKDTSGFLPGHGGVMDRVDGLGMAAVFCAGLLALAEGIHAALGLSAG